MSRQGPYKPGARSAELLRPDLISFTRTPTHRSVVLSAASVYSKQREGTSHTYSRHATRPYLTRALKSEGDFIILVCPSSPSFQAVSHTMMCNPHFNYSQYYLSQHLTASHYQADMPSHDLDQGMQAAQSPQSQMTVDQSLQLYYSGYDSFQNGQHHAQHQHQHSQPQLPSLMIPQQPPMNVPALSPHSSSSHSDYADTPPIDGADLNKGHVLWY